MVSGGSRRSFKQTRADSQLISGDRYSRFSLPEIGISPNLCVFQITTAILTAVLLLTRHPEVQARAYEEIKAVVGTDRLPEIHDRASLPYLDCVIQEIHRSNPAIPLVTHANSKEDEYLGYRIPKKTWIMANVW